jgi:DNA-binding response OmpR family regulator
MKFKESPLADHNKREKNILVVEDDTDIGLLLCDLLSQETPHKAVWVSDGMQALQLASTMKPDLCITDYWLPSINGLELYDRLHEMKDLADMPTILISAYLPEHEVKKRRIVGIHKPFEIDDLLNIIERLLA